MLLWFVNSLGVIDIHDIKGKISTYLKLKKLFGMQGFISYLGDVEGSSTNGQFVEGQELNN